MRLILTVALITSMGAFAQNSIDTTQTKDKPVEKILKEAKKERKKKIEMCHDCGKPEVDCDCKGEEHKKEEE